MRLDDFIYFAICNIYLVARVFKHLVQVGYDLLSLLSWNVGSRESSIQIDYTNIYLHGEKINFDKTWLCFLWV